MIKDSLLFLKEECTELGINDQLLGGTSSLQLQYVLPGNSRKRKGKSLWIWKKRGIIIFLTMSLKVSQILVKIHISPFMFPLVTLK
jgi:hypothetical protein